MKPCKHCGAHLADNADHCFTCDMSQECEHNKVLVKSKYWPGTYYQPPETEIYYAECAICGEVLDENDIPRDADLEEIE